MPFYFYNIEHTKFWDKISVFFIKFFSPEQNLSSIFLSSTSSFNKKAIEKETWKNIKNKNKKHAFRTWLLRIISFFDLGNAWCWVACIATCILLIKREQIKFHAQLAIFTFLIKNQIRKLNVSSSFAFQNASWAWNRWDRKYLFCAELLVF